MNNKISSIILIVLLSVLIAVLTFIMVYGIKDGGFKNKKVTLALSESYMVSDISDINIETRSSDIIVKDSEDDNVYVNIYSSSKDKVSSELTNGTLDIVSKSKFHFCFFCFRSGHKRVEVKLPSSYTGNIKISTKSGDMNIGSYKDSNLNIKATSGDIDIKNIKNVTIDVTSGDIEIASMKNANIKATSGDIELGKVKGKTNIKVTSGDIDIDNFEIKGNSTIKATSGDVTVKNIENAYISTSVKSGDIKVNGSERTADYELNITVTSGDIKVN